MEKNCESCGCREKCLYSYLRSEDKDILNQKKFFRQKKQGETLYEQGFHAGSLYMINSGVVKMTKENRHGNPITISTAQCCTMTGLESLQTNAVYKSTAVCVTDVSFCIIPREGNVNLLKENYKAREWFVAQYYQHMETLSNRVRDLMSGDVKMRIANAIWVLHRYYSSQKKCIEITREELADIAGTSRETVSRTLTALKTKKVLHVDGKCIRILKEDAIAKLAGIKMSEIG
ncbi:MAG: Crp/Fnr family transcriptional regulator [Chitinophagales bacterium]|nr:Crp/Fnr family transcriptional regulator [Chitinophagales bacterium]